MAITKSAKKALRQSQRRRKRNIQKKDTIKNLLSKQYPGLNKLITTTSRTKRPGEIDGQDHYFLTRKEFENKIAKGIFAEYVEYGGNLYGTQKTELEKALKNDTIWRIDPSRAGEVRNFIKRFYSAEIAEKLIKRVLVIYITVSDEIVLQRLKKRGLTEEEIQKRMADDQKIWQQYQDSYDFVIENVPGKLDETVDKIVNIIKNRAYT